MTNTEKAKKDYLNSYKWLAAKKTVFEEKMKTGKVFIRRYDKEVAELNLKLKKIENEINAIDNKKYVVILTLKHIYGDTLKSISQKLHYSLRHIQRLYHKALEAFIILN